MASEREPPPDQPTSLTDLFGLPGIDGVVERCQEIARGIGGFKVVQSLGRGAEGSVFEAYSPEGRRVALKVVWLDPFEPRRAALIRERLTALLALRHCGLVAPLAIVDGSERWIGLSMELVEGQGIAEHLAAAEGRRVSRALECGVDVARALDYCHRTGLVHGDVKPENVLVRPDGSAVLVDLGCARDPRSAPSTRSLGARGTFGFMAPELFLPGSEVSGRTDVFALGMTLFRLVTGRLRTASSGSEVAEIEEACRAALVSEVPRVRPIDSARLAAALVRATELEPGRRFASAAELGSELEAILGGEPSQQAPRTSSRNAVQQHTSRVVVGAVLIALAVALVAVAYARRVWCEGTGFRIVRGRGVVFENRFGAEIGAEAVDLGAVADAGVYHERRGDLLVLTADDPGKPGEVHLFSIHRAHRVEGWEKPLVLSEAVPPSWKPLDPYDADARTLRLNRPRIVDLDGSGEPALLVTAVGATWATCGLVRVDLDRRVGGSYFQFGRFELEELVDLDGDGVLDAVCAGVNNYVKSDDSPPGVNPTVVFAVRGIAFRREGTRVEGPPGRPGVRDQFDAPVLFYQVLGPFRRGDKFLPPNLALPGALRWHAAERRFRLHAFPWALPDDTFSVFFDSMGNYMRTDPTLGDEEQTRRHGAPFRAEPPVPLVVDGVRTPLCGRVRERENNGIAVHTLHLAR